MDHTPDSADLGPTVDLPGIVPFNELRSRRGYRLNQFLVSMRSAAARDAFVRDPEACMAAQKLTDRERQLLRDKDFDAMLDYGASIYALGKVSHLLGTDLVGIGARSRGESREAFVGDRLAGVRR